MKTKREWLAEQGLAIAGARGKFSNAAKQALAKAEAEGMKFADSATPTKNSGQTKDAGNSDKSEAPSKNDPTVTQYLFPNEYRFPEAQYRGIVYVDGKRKEVSLREVCNTCRVSLVGHFCDNPIILGDQRVKIEKR